ncbi:CPXCG motif-containing cysteine-rich protein [Pseudidiomarina salilacus]|uniref:CPXCG motif-containing cysteine-rich protein n=1 Tax=Pseudidiomarina salilacus TaxID=3384452 RepID=UPI0039851A1B
MSLTYESEFSCPYCMAPNSIEVDPLYDIGQQQIVDCQICCQPIEVVIVELAAGDFEVIARTDDE